jgi:hypothetical protein
MTTKAAAGGCLGRRISKTPWAEREREGGADPRQELCGALATAAVLRDRGYGHRHALNHPLHVGRGGAYSSAMKPFTRSGWVSRFIRKSTKYR